MAIGVTRDNDFLIKFCVEQKINPRAAIGELEAVVIFMKAAVSKNRVVDKIEKLFDA